MFKPVTAIASAVERLDAAFGRLLVAALRALAVPDLRDWLVFGGVACAAYGAGQVYGPAGWIVAGVAFFYLGARR